MRGLLLALLFFFGTAEAQTITPGGGGGGGITALTGDVTASGTGTVTAILPTVNSNTGPCGDATDIPTVTNNAKGLTTACTTTPITTATIGAQPQSVYSRAPTSSDVTGYTAGVSQWIDQTGQPWQLSSVVGGLANWTPAPYPGLYPCSTSSLLAAWCGGGDPMVKGWTNSLYTVWRPTDGQTMEVGSVNGGADYQALLAFAQPSAGILYVQQFHDQTDNGTYDNVLHTAYDAVAPLMPNNAMRVDLDDATPNGVGGWSVPLVSDSTLRNYWYGVQASYAITNTSGSTSFCFATITGYPTTMTSTQSGLWMMAATLPVSGTGIPASTTIATYVPTTGCGTLSAATTAAATAMTVTYGNSAVYYNLPSTLSVPMENDTVLVSERNGNVLHSVYELTLGVTSSSTTTSFPMLGWSLTDYGTNSTCQPSGRMNWKVSSGGGSATTGGCHWVSNNDQVAGYSISGTGGRTVTIQTDGQQFTTTTSPTLLANPLTGGILSGISPEYSSYSASSAKTNDYLFYGASVYSSGMTPAQMGNYTLAETLRRGWRHGQVVNGIVGDGSSTTFGNGWVMPAMWIHQVGDRLAAAGHPVNVWNQAQGGGIELSTYEYATGVGSLATAPNAQNLLEVWFPGMGNSMQLGAATLTITGTSGNVLTTSTSLYGTAGNLPSTNAAPLSNISGSPGGCLQTGTQITAFLSSTTFTVSPAPVSACTSVSVLNDTGASAWASLQAYDNGAVKPYVMIGSAARGSFSTSTAPYGSGTQLGEFGTLKSILQAQCSPDVTGYSAHCNGLPNLIGYVDLEAMPYWGGDAGQTVVSSVVDSTHVVVTAPGTALANFLAAGNRIQWNGMPVNATPSVDTGYQTITAVSGSYSPYTLTVSASTSGMYVGETIRAFNPTPWTTYPCTSSGVGYYSTGVWNIDKQHFCNDKGYDTIAARAAAALLATGLLH